MIFKKISLPFLFLTFLFSFSQAQVSLGIQFGESHFTEKSKIEPESLDIMDERYKSGFYVGLYAKFKIKNHWYIQPELSFIQKGFGRKGIASFGAPAPPTLSSEYKSRTVYNYIEVPILVKFEIPIGEKHRLELGAGPSIGLLFGKLKYMFKTDDLKTVDHYDYVVDLTDENGNSIGTRKWNKIDAGMCIDLSYSYHLNTGAIKLGARNYIDFTNSFSYTDEEKQNLGFDAKYTNLGFAFYVGYEIPLGGNN